MRTCAILKAVHSIAALGHITAHGRRSHASVQHRVDNNVTAQNLATSAYADDPLDVVAAYKRRVASSGAAPYGRSPIAAHLLLALPPALIDEGGHRHERDNPVSRALFEQGVAWAEEVFGAGSVIAARLDCDEAGCGLLDVVVVPVRRVRINRYAERMIISLSGALEALRARYDARKSFTALQTSWAEHANISIDPRLERGIAKELTGQRHVDHHVFRPAAEAHRERMEEEQRQHRAMIDAETASQQAERATIERGKQELALSKREVEGKADELAIERRRVAAIPLHYKLCARAYVLGHLKLVERGGQQRLHIADHVPADARGELRRVVEWAERAGFDPWLLRRLGQDIAMRAMESSDHGAQLRL